MKFIKNTILTFSTQIITVILGLVSSIIIARILGPEGRGAYSLLILVPTMLSTIGNLGIGIANVYYGGKGKYKWSTLASNSISAALSLGLLLTVSFLVYYYSFHPVFFKNIDPKLLTVIVFTIPFSLIINYFQQILLGQSRIKAYNFINIMQSIVSLILILLLLMVIRKEVEGAIIAFVCTAVLVAILTIIMVSKSTKIELKFNTTVLFESIKFGIQGQLSNIIQFLNYRLDMIMVNMFMNVTSVGYYSISVGLAESLWYFPAAVGTIVFAQTPGLSESQANETTPKICRNTLLITFFAALLLFVTGKYIIILLYGNSYLPALKPFWILLPGIVALSICKVLSNELTGRGYPIINTYATGASLVANIILNIIFIPRIGIEGAALASTVSYIITAIIVLSVFLKISKNSIIDTLIAKPDDIYYYFKLLSKARNTIKLKLTSTIR
jgi:O-antigen/teichoic acid export membrane protein